MGSGIWNWSPTRILFPLQWHRCPIFSRLTQFRNYFRKKNWKNCNFLVSTFLQSATNQKLLGKTDRGRDLELQCYCCTATGSPIFLSSETFNLHFRSNISFQNYVCFIWLRAWELGLGVIFEVNNHDKHMRLMKYSLKAFKGNRLKWNPQTPTFIIKTGTFRFQGQIKFYSRFVY